MATPDDLRHILAGGKPKPEEEETEDDLGPCARVSTAKWCHGLNVVRKGKPVEMFQFQFLGVRSEYTPEKFWVVFAGQHEIWKVTVHGRNLARLFYCLKEHRLEEIREANRDFAADNEPIVLRIEVQEIEVKR
jgi:hypothetical protein